MTNEQAAMISGALNNTAAALRKLGTNDAYTEFGAIEAHAMEAKEGAEKISGSLLEVSRSLDDVAESIGRIADALCNAFIK